ncbi:unnamed protein product [Thlaspi arvense]|uniref:Uncharacterized protein n=1 Tax=Thlaspi arvense TaxID=13288 RepID=A0AAU9SKC4_THLAR|nr:unnamed protein product [Thlaspi arvense]
MAGEEQKRRWSLQGKTALVTGSTKGIGHAIVEELAGFGVIVHTCARDEAQLNECLSEWKKKRFQVTGVKAIGPESSETAKSVLGLYKHPKPNTVSASVTVPSATSTSSTRHKSFPYKPAVTVGISNRFETLRLCDGE